MIIGSQRLGLGKFVFSDAKRHLQTLSAPDIPERRLLTLAHTYYFQLKATSR